MPAGLCVGGRKGGGGGVYLAASLVRFPPHIQHVVLLEIPGDQEVQEGCHADERVDAAEDETQQDDDCVIWYLQASMTSLEPQEQM